MKNKFKIGDTVRIKPLQWFIDNGYSMDSQGHYISSRGPVLNKYMLKYLDGIYIIYKEYYYYKDQFHLKQKNGKPLSISGYISTDEYKWVWCSTWLEKEASKIHINDNVFKLD